MKFNTLLLLLLLTSATFASALFGQDTIKSKVTVGIRMVSSYDFEVYHDNNFRTIHLAPLFSVNFKHHNFFLGPQYSYVFQDPNYWESCEQNSYGLNFGYRHYSNYLFKNTRLFGEFTFSIFQVKFTDYNRRPPYTTKREEIYVENTGSLGLDYTILNQLHISCGFGFGSYTGFFLIFEKFTLTSYLGVEYVF